MAISKRDDENVVIVFNDGEKHRLHPVKFRKTAEHFGSLPGATFEQHCDALRKADPSIARIRKVAR